MVMLYVFASLLLSGIVLGTPKLAVEDPVSQPQLKVAAPVAQPKLTVIQADSTSIGQATPVTIQGSTYKLQ